MRKTPLVFLFLVFLLVGCSSQATSVNTEKEKKPELYWAKEVELVKAEESMSDVHKVCKLTVQKEVKVAGESTPVEKKKEQVVFIVNKRVCPDIKDTNVTKLDIAYKGNLVVKELYFYILGERVKYE